ncbi:MAG: lutB [Marmoricola sp.]|nr:lutB [Marmoricola sp.]
MVEERASTSKTSARDEILARVRAATATAPPVEYAAPAHATAAGSVDLFVERVADYRAVVERCPAADLASRVAAAVEGCSVVVPEGLGVDVPGAVTDNGLTSLELDAIDAVVTAATLGIAETGTIVLDHGPGQGRRAITLVPDRHVCIVRADQVLADVPDAVALLDPHRPLTWISGPSATSDIELNRVEGVHGPRNLHVIVVEG